MNRNQASGFGAPFLRPDTEFNSDLDLDLSPKIPSSQPNPTTPSYSDSPNRDDTSDPNYLDLTDKLDPAELFAKIEGLLKERMKTVTMKESLVYFKNLDRNPGFLGISLRFNPSYASDAMEEVFKQELKKVEQDVRRSFYEKMISQCDTIMLDYMKKAHELFNTSIAKLDITDPESGKIRTELFKKFDTMTTNFKRERAKYAAKLRAKKETVEADKDHSAPKYFTKEGRERFAKQKKRMERKH
ncbi:unnamed protein product [Mytilus edulis]|uniref:Uncharacterized protein n=1 Tax=Mytilus edulis TaxID=6550 RepID=A0A8S3S3I6_MYTED|nr:unnamed protein product [Mytilus edulis]